jgi:hypothetical protein
MVRGTIYSIRGNLAKSASRARRASGLSKARTTVTKAPADSKYNKPVYRKLRRPRRAFTKTGRNTNAITTLARQVKSLQNRQYGDLQTNTQFYGNPGASYLPQQSKPVAFLLSSFYDETVYQGDVSGTSATFVTAGTFARQTLTASLDDQYEWNARRNSEIVSPVTYKPVFTRISMRFFVNYAGLSYPGRLRVTIFKVKAYKASNKFDCSLPHALGAYRNMCDSPASSTRNYFDKSLHTVLYDKFLKISPRTVTAGETDNRAVELTIPFRFPDVVYRPDFTDHPPNQTFWTNTPIHHQIWCMISADNDIFGHLTGVHIGRFNMWRDAHGVN